MLDKASQFYRENRLILAIFFTGTLFDATSTSLAFSNSIGQEVNPISRALIIPESHVATIVTLSLVPMLVLAAVFICWDRVEQKKFWEILLEGSGMFQILCGINNTPYIIGYGHPITILPLIAALVYYAETLTNIRKRGRYRRDKLRQLPNP